jgi:NAD(P)-dependent dehydrogenase (short-subunit alcohol dehydrogenase family)
MKTALVTGANKGIGYEVARQLAGKGFQIFVGARNREAGQKAVAKIAEEGGKAIFLEIDVADNPSVTVAARAFAKAGDYLDVLVNNAGIIVDGDNAILEISDELLRRTLETNTLGALRVTRAFVPLLRKSKSAARDQCLQWRRAVDRRCGWLVAGLLYFEDRAQRRDLATGHRVAEVCGEFSLSRLGTHGYGRASR